MPLTKVLVATDHSDSAQRAEEFAGRLAGPNSPLEVALLYVRPELPVRVGRTGLADVYLPTQKLTVDERQQMHALLTLAAEHVRQAAGDNPIQVSEDMAGGSDVGATIVHEAERLKVEAIVMGARGHSGLAGLLVGSTSHKVLHLASCPVIVVR
jgi:nucleotide-binding universal stress UspA family protein